MKKYLLYLSVVLLLPFDVRSGGYELVGQKNPFENKTHLEVILQLNNHIVGHNCEAFRNSLAFLKSKKWSLNTVQGWPFSCDTIFRHLPLMVAVFYGRLNMIEDLINEGADVTAVNHQQCGSVLHHLMAHEGDGQSLSMANLLLNTLPTEKKKRFINGEKSQAPALLSVAIWHSQVSNVIFLIQQGANVKSKNRGGYTPLHEACVKKGDLPNTRAIVRLLIQAGADEKIKSPEGWLPADRTQDSEIREMLRNAPEIRTQRAFLKKMLLARRSLYLGQLSDDLAQADPK
jgi:ankyrin repeat protein